MRYAMSGSWWPERLTISDDSGTACFEVRNRPGFATMLSLSVAGGEKVASIRRRRGGRFQVIAGGREAGLVRWRRYRYDIHSTLWPLAAAGSVPDGRYSITCDGLAQAKVSRQIARRCTAYGEDQRGRRSRGHRRPPRHGPGRRGGPTMSMTQSMILCPSRRPASRLAIRAEPVQFGGRGSAEGSQAQPMGVRPLLHRPPPA